MNEHSDSFSDSTENSQRSIPYAKNERTEQSLARLNQQLAASSFLEEVEGDAPRQPVTFVIGMQRSGTTLLMQLLTRCFEFTYPDNVVARFPAIPAAGVIVSRSLREQFAQRPPRRDEASASDQQVPRNRSDDPDGLLLQSHHGVTLGPFEPHEFGYFWERWFHFQQTHELSIDDLRRVDVTGFRRALFLMEHFGTAPLLLKGVALAMNFAYLAENLPGSRFLYIRRENLYAGQSTWLTRRQRYGDESRWWSLKPADVSKIQELPVAEQIAGQIRAVRQAIEKQLKSVDPNRVLTLRYEDLCRSPQDAMRQIEAFLPHVSRNHDYQPPDELPSGNVQRLADVEFRALKTALNGVENPT